MSQDSDSCHTRFIPIPFFSEYLIAVCVCMCVWCVCVCVVGCGGQIVPPPGYLQRCYDAVRAAGGVCIAGRRTDTVCMYVYIHVEAVLLRCLML